MAKEIIVDFKELAELIVREHDIHEGLWGIWVRFGIGGTNIGPDAQSLAPAAVIPILELGIQRFDAPNNLTVDAAELRRASGHKGKEKRPVRARRPDVVKAKR